MTNQHRATPEQWAHVEACAPEEFAGYACILELRARVEALEKAQHTHTLDCTGFSEQQVQAVAALISHARGAVSQPWVVQVDGIQHGPAVPPPAPADSLPVDSLVWRVMAALSNTGSDLELEARAAIREVAAWLRDRTDGYASDLLDAEANR